MKFLITNRTSGGGFFTTEMTPNEFLDYNIFGILVTLCLLAVFSVLLSGILLIFSIFVFGQESRILSIIGFIASLYLLIDLHYHWILNLLISLFENEKKMNFIFNINFVFLICHLFLIFFDRKTSKLLVLLSVIIIGLISYCNIKNTHLYNYSPRIEKIK
jgi:hypothetical protein